MGGGEGGEGRGRRGGKEGIREEGSGGDMACGNIDVASKVHSV